MPPVQDEKPVDIQVTEAVSAGDMDAAGTLFREYAASLGFDLSFQNFEEEVRSLPGAYASPEGCLLLARVGIVAAGCVALRRLGDGVCEMKRLYVRPEFRRHHLGRRLALAVIDRARSAGYRTMRLDTIASMEAARGLYRSMGFREIPAYRFNPVRGAMYMELDLRPGDRS